MDIKITFSSEFVSEETATYSQPDATAALHFVAGFIKSGARISSLEVL
jgi:hypothetical protein